VFKLTRTRLVILNVILPLIIGGLIYISFRSVNLRMFVWFDAIGIHELIYKIRELFNPFKSYIPKWIYFSLPDGLWVYSFSYVLLLIWKDKLKVAIVWLIIPFTAGCLVELAQLIKVFPGTFDYLDLIMSSLGIISSLLILKYKNEKKPYKNT